MNILLVDDSRTIRNIQKNVLKQLGYTDITEAEDGVQALAQFKDSAPNLMLIDWNMPNMDRCGAFARETAQGINRHQHQDRRSGGRAYCVDEPPLGNDRRDKPTASSGYGKDPSVPPSIQIIPPHGQGRSRGNIGRR